MAQFLLATDSVHTTAAACDYLAERVDDADTVIVLGVAEPGLAGRDPGDAANVARTRLVEPTVEVVTRDGEPAEAIRAVADDRDVDDIVVGATRGDPESAGDPPGSTVRALLAASRWPVTVLPAPAP
jgi:nucleotide-binding universal stress UspA family protein